MRIVEASAHLADIAVETVRTDAVQSFIKQETVFVDLVTEDGNRGTGYAYTIGTGGTSVLAMLRAHLLPRLIGADARQIEYLWHDLFASTRATTVGAITSLALAAVDTALWDLRCLRAGEPLWRVAGGFRREVPLYDTEGGWLHLSTDELVRGALAAQAAGWPGVKLKVGKPHVTRDVERLRAVREAVGPELEIMVDANQSMTAAEARRRAAAFEPLELAWFEEPLPADDVSGHAVLARSTCAGRRYHAVAEGRAPGRGLQRARMPALPDGAARQPRRRDPQRPLRRTHPTTARDHPRPAADRERPRHRARRSGTRHRLGPGRDRGPSRRLDRSKG